MLTKEMRHLAQQPVLAVKRIEVGTHMLEALLLEAEREVMVRGMKTTTGCPVGHRGRWSTDDRGIHVGQRVDFWAGDRLVIRAEVTEVLARAHPEACSATNDVTFRWREA